MLRITACATALLALCATARASEPAHSAEIDEMIARQAKIHGVPEKLVRRIVMRESKYNPHARNHSFWGLMQISYPTARSMGFKGSPRELLDPLVNLTYAVPYLANAFIIAGKQEDAAVRLYASGYYATAKNRNLLDQLRTADSAPLAPAEGFLTATARPVSNLITAVVSGSPAAAPQPTEAAPAPSIQTAASDKGAEPEVPMVAGKKGNTPPVRWIKDGGISLIARGEQSLDQVAAYNPPADAETKSKAGRHAARKTKKNTEFASLDAPPAAAQAYAPGASPAPESSPQAAIAQAIAAPVAAPGEAAAAAPDSPAADSTEEKSHKKPPHVRRATASKKAPHPVAVAAKAEESPASSTIH